MKLSLSRSLRAGIIGVAKLTLCLQAVATAGPGTPAASKITLSATASFVNQYMFRGERLGGPSFQPTIDGTYGDLAVGLWSNFPLQDKLAGQSDPEFNLYGSYSLALNDRVTLVPGWTLYTYPRAPTDVGFFRATLEPNLVLNFTIADLGLAPRISYDLDTHESTGEVSASYALPLLGVGTEIDLTGTLGTHTLSNAEYGATPRVKAWGNFWSLGAAVPYQIPGAGKLTFGWAYTRGSGAFMKRGSAPKEVNPLAAGRGIIAVSYAMEF